MQCSLNYTNSTRQPKSKFLQDSRTPNTLLHTPSILYKLKIVLKWKLFVHMKEDTQQTVTANELFDTQVLSVDTRIQHKFTNTYAINFFNNCVDKTFLFSHLPNIIIHHTGIQQFLIQPSEIVMTYKHSLLHEPKNNDFCKSLWHHATI